MSLTYAPLSAYSNDSVHFDGCYGGGVGGVSAFHGEFTGISSQLQALERCPDVREENEEEEEEVAPAGVEDSNGEIDEIDQALKSELSCYYFSNMKIVINLVPKPCGL